MLIFEASAGNELWPHLLRPAGLQAAAKGSSWVGPKLIRPTSGYQGAGPPFTYKWGHDLPTEPRVLLLVQDLHIRVINADTGELIRELTLNTAKRYQATGKPSGWPKKTPQPLCGFAVSSMSCDITVVAGVGFEPT